MFKIFLLQSSLLSLLFIALEFISPPLVLAEGHEKKQQALLKKNNIQSGTRFYRIVSLKEANQYLRRDEKGHIYALANPHMMASVEDWKGEKSASPFAKAIVKDENKNRPAGEPEFTIEMAIQWCQENGIMGEVCRIVEASDLKLSGLNVSRKNPAGQTIGYGGAGSTSSKVIFSLTWEQVAAQKGEIYQDKSAMMDALDPYVLTLPKGYIKIRIEQNGDKLKLPLLKLAPNQSKESDCPPGSESQFNSNIL